MTSLTDEALDIFTLIIDNYIDHGAHRSHCWPSCTIPARVVLKSTTITTAMNPMIRSLATLATVLLLAALVQSLAPLSHTPSNKETPCSLSKKKEQALVSESVSPTESITPVIIEKQTNDEREKETLLSVDRRAFMATSLISLGLITTTTIMEPASAASVRTTQVNQEEPTNALSSTTTATSDAAAAAAAATSVDWKGIVQKASKRALGGGKAGASAAVVQVCCLMWLRTSMNYQVNSISSC